MSWFRYVVLGAAVASSLVACKDSHVAAPDGPANDVAPVPSGSPLSRLVPPARPGPRAACPLTIEPGVAFGPVLLGETLADLERAGLVVKNATDTFAEVALGTTTLKVTLCQGKIIDIWIDDLRTAPACVAFGGTTFTPTIPREDLEKALGGCTDTPPRIGGAFERCQDGGVYVGHGLGTFLQIRVRPKSFPFDNACAIASDDGSPIALSPSERDSMLAATLNLRELSPYWHVTTPGRDPLRIVKTSLVPEQPLTMFGSPVVWIDESEAKKGTAFLRITSLTATKTKAKLAFEYPIEGIAGSATFAHVSGTNWRLESGEAHER